MNGTIQLGEISVNVTLKDVKNVHLSVYPPSGAVRISAPKHMSFDAVRIFAISKLDWIKRERKKLQDQERETPREYLDRESHFLWGERYLLKIEEVDGPPEVKRTPRHLLLRLRPGTDEEMRQALVARWYRDQLRAELPALIAKWKPIIGVEVAAVFVQRMKTKWGSCKSASGNIRVNTELAKKPRECLEYILVHEMTHLLEPTHNPRFQELMDQFMPNWRTRRDELNRAPLAHESWAY